MEEENEAGKRREGGAKVEQIQCTNERDSESRSFAENISGEETRNVRLFGAPVGRWLVVAEPESPKMEPEPILHSSDATERAAQRNTNPFLLAPVAAGFLRYC